MVLLDRGADTEARDGYDWSPLEQAINEDHLEVVQVLLDHGADVKGQDKYNRTPLQYIARKEKKLFSFSLRTAQMRTP